MKVPFTRLGERCRGRCGSPGSEAAQGARDEELLAVVQACEGETAIHARWLTTRMKQAAPQALVVA